MKAKRRTLLILVMSAILIFAMSACGAASDKPATEPPAANGSSADAPAADVPAASGKVYEWNFGTITPDPAITTEFNSWGMGFKKFIERVETESNGQIKITAHWQAVLGGSPQMFEQCEMGELDLFSAQPMSGADPRFAAWNIPYTFTSYDQVIKAIDPDNGKIYKMTEEWIADHNMKLLGLGCGAFRGLANSKHEVIKPEDMKDLKVRVYEDELVRTFWEGLGTTAVLPINDVYASLQTGNVDAVEMHDNQMMAGNYYQVTSYFSDLNWQWLNSAFLTVNQQSWDELTPELQAIVADAAREFSQIQIEQQLIDSPKAFDAMEANGMTITRLTDEQRQVWEDYSDTLVDSYKRIIGEETYNEYMAAVEEYTK